LGIIYFILVLVISFVFVPMFRDTLLSNLSFTEAAVLLSYPSLDLLCIILISFILVLYYQKQLRRILKNPS